MVYHKQLTTNKSFELQFEKWKEWNWFEFYIGWTRHQDHAGIKIDVEICGINLIVQIYDHRHWNHEKNRWYDDGEEQPDTDSVAMERNSLETLHALYKEIGEIEFKTFLQKTFQDIRSKQPISDYLLY